MSDILETIWPSVLFSFAPREEIDPKEATFTLARQLSG